MEQEQKGIEDRMVGKVGSIEQLKRHCRQVSLMVL